MKQPRRILHLISRLDSYGGARILRDLAASQAAAGERVIVAALVAEHEPTSELRDRGVAVQALGSRWPVDVVALGRLARLRRQLAADVIHAWDMRMLVQAALAGSRPRRSKLIASLGVAKAPGRWKSRLLRLAHKRVAALVVPDESARQRLAPLGVDDARVHLIRPGVLRGAPIDAAKRRAALLAHLKLPAEARLVAVAGPLRRGKNLDEAIWAFELVRVLHPHARMLICGDGPDRARLERFAAQVSEPGCVRFLGYRDDLAELLSGVDVFWQLDAAIATPLALLEAEAAGAPVVASDVPAHQAAVIDDRTGCLTPVGSRAEVARATDELFANPQRAERLAAAASAFVAKRWSLDATLGAYDRLYERLLSGPSPPRDAVA